ncbi:MAG: hypothetical protein R2800_12650 [Flavipsychrobacter sp.]
MSTQDQTSKHKDFLEWYINNQKTYATLARKVESILKELLDVEKVNYHYVSCREKDIKSLSKKLDTKNYNNPKEEITDLAGVRIVTYVEDDNARVSRIVEDNFTIDKENSVNKGEELGVDKVGYKSIHYIASMSDDRLALPEYKRFKNLKFEIQIRTILQHAWAEIEHDRNYKFSGVLPDDIQRRFGLLAAAMESADREFNSISNKIDEIAQEVKESALKGNLDFPINSTTIKEYFKTKFKNLFDNNIIPEFFDSEREKLALEELKKFGLVTLSDLDKIIPEKFEEHAISHFADYRNFNALNAIIVSILITHDYKKYLEEVKTKEHWENNTATSYKDFWGKFNIDTDLLTEKYGITFSK